VIAAATPLAVAFLGVVATMAALSGEAPSRRRKLLLVLVALGLVLAPCDGQHAGRFLSGISASWSVPTVCLLAAYVAKRWTGRELLDARALRAAWLFGVTAGVVVLPATLSGLVGPYGLGWGSAGLPALVWVVTATLIVTGNRFGLVLGLGVLAFDLRLLESQNLWDYVVDPVFALVSLIALARGAVRRAARLRPGLPAAPHDT
jgi:hypothetical protein